MKLVEEVARAICARHKAPNHLAFMADARAAFAVFITALRREPSQEMLDAGIGTGACEMSDLQPARPEAIWSAMVAERLKEWGE